jgi:hypothetical protein
MKSKIKKATGEVALVKPTHLNSKAKIKQTIVKLACWGIIPVAMANWLIRLGGLIHE